MVVIYYLMNDLNGRYVMPPKRDPKTGRFVRKYRNWDLKYFDEGYVNSNGRFIVLCPDHPRASKSGWVFRSIVAYETYHNIKVTKEYDIHHKDGNKLNDSKGNLIKIKHGKHSRLHNVGIDRRECNKHLRKGKYLKCESCGIFFYRPQWVMNHNRSKRVFCSTECYHNRGNNVDN